MTKQEVADYLENYNKWRRWDEGDEEIEMPHPKELGVAIELAVKFLRES